MENLGINYRLIFEDILAIKYPEKKSECSTLLQKEKLSAFDIITINKIIFGDNITTGESRQKYHSYKKSDIIDILSYQKQNGLNNNQLAKYFGLSRNTITNWKKRFLV